MARSSLLPPPVRLSMLPKPKPNPWNLNPGGAGPGWRAGDCCLPGCACVGSARRASYALCRQAMMVLTRSAELVAFCMAALRGVQ